MNKILRSLPAKWRPKVTAIEEAKDLNTLSVEDLISSLKCHKIGLNEQEPVRNPTCKIVHEIVSLIESYVEWNVVQAW